MDRVQNARVVRFGAFEADLHTRELRKHGLKLKLQGQPFQVLAMLLARLGDLVTREEIRSRLWAQDTFIVCWQSNPTTPLRVPSMKKGETVANIGVVADKAP